MTMSNDSNEMIGREATCKEKAIDCNHLGNAAEMRKTLIKVRSAICHFARYQCQSLSWEKSNIQANCCDVLCSWRDLCDAKTAINAALSAPPRNCDRFATAKEAGEAFISEACENPCGNCTVSDECHNPLVHECGIDWLFAKAKGETK